jgi:hypothetical protein
MGVLLCYDSTSAADIPVDAPRAAGYVNGAFRWTPDDWGRFPAAARVTISIDAFDPVGDVLDVEQGDAKPEEANGWVAARQARGLWRPTIYGSASTLALVRPLMARGGLECDWWLADPTGVLHLPDGAMACQAQWPGKGSAGHYDVSLCDDRWPRRSPPAPVALPPAVMPAPRWGWRWSGWRRSL